MVKSKIALFVSLLGCAFSSLQSQEFIFNSKNVGFNVSANFAVGSHFQRFGLNFNFLYINKFFQSNTELRTYFSFKNLGPPKIYNELVFAQGLVFGYGPKKDYYNPFVNSVSNQTSHASSVAYSYNVYFNKIRTKQVTGIISLQFNNVSVVMENDIFAKQFLDRFRTGAFLIQYQYRDIVQAGINCTMWTGAMGKSVKHEDTHFIGSCYMDTTGGTFTEFSHGLLSAQIKYNIGLAQNVQINVGIDAERVRDVMQNKLIHDVGFVPKNWFHRYNCHIPMLDDKAEQYIYKPGQKIKNPVFYWNTFSNANLFY